MSLRSKSDRSFWRLIWNVLLDSALPLVFRSSCLHGYIISVAFASFVSRNSCFFSIYDPTPTAFSYPHKYESVLLFSLFPKTLNSFRKRVSERVDRATLIDFQLSFDRISDKAIASHLLQKDHPERRKLNLLVVGRWPSFGVLFFSFDNEKSASERRTTYAATRLWSLYLTWVLFLGGVRAYSYIVWRKSWFLLVCQEKIYKSCL